VTREANGTYAEDDLLTTADVMARLKVSRTAVHRLRTSRELKSFKVGGLVRFHRADLDAYIEAQRAA
jgi:excisionase family DNA binding protein